MKRFFALLAVFLVLLSIVCLPVAATDDKKQQIHSAQIQVILNEDGSADITETWEVSFLSGEFSRFRKEIYTDVTAEEKFTAVTNVSVFIDGEECPESKSDGYSIEKTSDKFIIYANKKSQNVTRTYTFCYTLTDVVKKLDENTSFFCYRFVGKNHSLKIGTLDVSITAPWVGTFDTEYLSRGTESVMGATIRYHAKNSLGLFKVSFNFDSVRAFGVPLKQSGSDNAGSFIGLIIFALIGLGIGTPIYLTYKKAKKAREEAEQRAAQRRLEAAQHPEELPVLLDTLQEHFTATQILSLVLTNKGSIRILQVILAELILSGNIYLSEDLVLMILERNAQPPQHPYQQQCLALIYHIYDQLVEDRQIDPALYPDMLSFEQFTSYITENAEKLRDQFSQIRDHLGANLLRNHPQIESLLPAANKLIPHIQIRQYPYISFCGLLNTAKDGKLDTLSAIDYMCTTADSEEFSPIDQWLAPLRVIVNPWLGISTHSSDSGCSSCSSCSSCCGCSGCGGCGGD